MSSRANTYHFTVPERTARTRGQTGCRLCICSVLLVLLMTSGTAWSYQGEIHQRLTFIAARQFNLCAPDVQLPVLSPLQVRYIARSSVKESDSRLVRTFRWGFYERGEQAQKHFLGLVQTRLHRRFEKLTEAAERADDLLEYYSIVGRMMAHLQDMSVPVYVVPIYFNRFWRLSMRDRLNAYPIDAQLLAARLAERSCEALLGDSALAPQSAQPTPPVELLDELADSTIQAIQQPIFGQEPTTWESFWRLGREGRFGRYGAAGNRFGERTEFTCGDQTCVFLEDDPLYREFAIERHLDALQSSLRFMRWAQHSEG